MIGIYKITNLLNQKVYIGQSIHIERRFSEHCQPSAKSLIGKAIQKYGKENFTFQILEECSIDTLVDREEFYIKQNNSIVPNGYNIEEPLSNRSIYYVVYGKDILEEIVSLLKTSNMIFSDIAQKYDLSLRTITRLNQGHSHKLENEIYPLRQIAQSSQKYCSNCGVQISTRSRSNLCNNCYRQFEKKVSDRPERAELKKLIRSNTFAELGRIYGVSDNTIRKWCKKENLPYRSIDIKNISNEEWMNI